MPWARLRTFSTVHQARRTTQFCPFKHPIRHTDSFPSHDPSWLDS